MVKIHDKHFKLYISQEEIKSTLTRLAEQIDRDFADECPILLGVLDGAFIFLADLVRAMTIDCEVSFVKIKSYQGTESNNQASTVLGMSIDVKNRPVIVIEDIVDTGHTLHSFCQTLQAFSPASIHIACLLHKPEALNYPLCIDYIGFEIPPKFVVGYGLDYDGLGRNYSDIYQIC